MNIRVIFTYDEDSRGWTPEVEGVSDSLEARQAFAAVVLSCGLLDPELLTESRTLNIESGWEIIPAV